MRRKVFLMAFASLLVLFLASCTSVHSGRHYTSSKFGVKKAEKRKLIWWADLKLDCWELKEATSKAIEITKKSGGYVESQSVNEDKSAVLSLRIPADKLNTSLDELETIGELDEKNVSSKDVTFEYIDTEAVLNNQIALRETLKSLLKKSRNIHEALELEKELSEIQARIDAMRTKLKTMDNQIQYAEVNLKLNRHKILGPMGYLFKGLFWGLEKMFVIRR